MKRHDPSLTMCCSASPHKNGWRCKIDSKWCFCHAGNFSELIKAQLDECLRSHWLYWAKHFPSVILSNSTATVAFLQFLTFSEIMWDGQWPL